MEIFWTVSIVIALIAIATQFALVLFLARELGAVLVRLGPDHAKPTDQGPEIGANLFRLGPNIGDELSRSLDLPSTLAISTENRLYSLLIFTTASCPHCRDLIAHLPAFIRGYKKLCRVAILNSGQVDTTMQPWLQVGSIITPLSEALREQLHVHVFPFSILLDRDGVVVSRGVANNVAQLESLFSVDVVHAGASHVLESSFQQNGSADTPQLASVPSKK